MKKLDLIKKKCEEAAAEGATLSSEGNPYNIEVGRAELAEEILEILNGEEK